MPLLARQKEQQKSVYSLGRALYAMPAADSSLRIQPVLLRVLLLCVRPRRNAATIADHIEAFPRYSRHAVDVVDNLPAMYGSLGGRIPALPGYLDLSLYDVLVLHYSNYLPSPQHLNEATKSRIAAYRGLKVLLLQDEYRAVNAMHELIRNLGIHVLYTCVPESEHEKVYPASRLPGLRCVTNLTGYVPERLLGWPVVRRADRNIDVGYRARKLPFWLGSLAAEKWQIAPKFIQATQGQGLRLDLSYREQDRLYGDAWTDFLMRCRTMLGVESGASVFDFTGELQATVEAYERDHPAATFEEIQQKFLAAHEGRIRLNQISPRCFEAAALRTGMVLYEGEYSGILQPWRHFIPLKKDFSNMDAVVAAIRDERFLSEMTDRAYDEIAQNRRYSYGGYIDGFDAVIEEEHAARCARAVGRAVPGPGGYHAGRRLLALCAGVLDLLDRLWGGIPEPLKRAIRPAIHRVLHSTRA